MSAMSASQLISPVPSSPTNPMSQDTRNQSPSLSELSDSSSPIISGQPSEESSSEKPKKRFHCKYEGCEQTFSTSGHLSRHMKIHTGIKNHVCPIEGCVARFSRKDNMMQHFVSHRKKKMSQEGRVILKSEAKQRAEAAMVSPGDSPEPQPTMPYSSSPHFMTHMDNSPARHHYSEFVIRSAPHQRSFSPVPRLTTPVRHSPYNMMKHSRLDWTPPSMHQVNSQQWQQQAQYRRMSQPPQSGMAPYPLHEMHKPGFSPDTRGYSLPTPARSPEPHARDLPHMSRRLSDPTPSGTPDMPRYFDFGVTRSPKEFVRDVREYVRYRRLSVSQPAPQRHSHPTYQRFSVH